MPLIYRILNRLGFAWLGLVAIGTLIAIPFSEGQRLMALAVGAACATPALLAFALAWVFKPPA